MSDRPLPTVILPGYLAADYEYRELASALEQHGVPTAIVPVKKFTWLPTLGGRSIVPILRLLHATAIRVRHEFNTEQINLVGHSAGGWISRIYIGEKPYCIHGDVTPDAGLWNARAYINTLVCLGTPQTSLERWTKRNLDFVSQNYPGAFYSDVRYVCIAGKAVFGQRSWKTWLAYNSYTLTCGDGNCWGDGITPISAAHLDGAENLVFDDVYHSPKPGRLWYGSPEVVDRWANQLKIKN